MKKRSFKSLFTKKRRVALTKQYNELDDEYVFLSNLYENSMKLRESLADGEQKNRAIEIEQDIFGQIKLVVYKMSVINKELEKLV